MKNIIFLSGLGVPKVLAKMPMIWNDTLWHNHKRIYLTSKIPTSDNMVKTHLKDLVKFINKFDDPVVVGQSLGAWWAANLACEPMCQMKKFVLCIPLADTNYYPIFNASPLFKPTNRTPNPQHYGPYKSLVVYASNDFIVPINQHAVPLERHFNALSYKLDGGHLIQSNHQKGLEFIKDWIELD